LSAAVLLVLAAPAANGAESPSSLRRQADDLRAREASLAAQSRSAVLELYALDSRLSRARGRLTALRAEVAALERERARVAARLATARRAVQISHVRVATRLRALYEQGEVDPVAIILGAESLDEALEGLEGLDRTATLDRHVLEEVRTARTDLVVLANAVEARRAKARRLAAEAEASAAALAAARSARQAYVRQLAAERDLTAQQVRSVEARARTAAQRARQLATATATAPAPSAPAAASVAAAPPPATLDAADQPAAGGKTMTVRATAYALPGRTATGVPVGWGVVAVDPSVIPLGTRMTIPGYGTGVAADTGGAVRGAHIDLWFPTTAQAFAWGTRTVTITIH
jgi:3D (Asp-Asp-Asp) domain-containing protein